MKKERKPKRGDREKRIQDDDDDDMDNVDGEWEKVKGGVPITAVSLSSC